MPIRHFTVTVPQPCQEDWSAMLPQLQGRFCQNCGKTVVDFTSMSDAEVVKWLSNRQSSTCGRFRESQLKRPLATALPVRRSWTWSAIALGLAAWLGSKTTEAKSLPAPPATEQQPTASGFSNLVVPVPSSASDSSRVIRGVVVDSLTHEPLPGATVHLKGTAVAVPTDANGYFLLDIPLSYDLEKQTIVYSLLGYENYEQRLNKSSFSQSVTIQLTPDIKGLFEPVFLGGAHFARWYTPRGLYYTVKNFIGYTIPRLLSGN